MIRYSILYFDFLAGNILAVAFLWLGFGLGDKVHRP